MRLSGKVALISGAGRGMGASHARAVVRHGGKVVVGDVLTDEVHEVASELGEGNAVAVTLDVRETSDWDAAVTAGAEAFGAVNVLVNNAGILHPKTLLGDVTDEDWQRLIDINVTGVFKGMRAVLAPMQEHGGSIINISSTSGLMGFPGQASYVASKFAVRGMTKAAALELAEHNIRVNSIHPGMIRTPMTAAIPFDYAPLVPLGRVGEADEISNLVVFLASDESSFSTGAEFVADGGETAGRKPN